MKKQLSIFLIAALTLTCSVTFAQKKNKKNDSKNTSALANKMDTISYIIGVDMGKSFKTNFFDVSPEALLAGIKDGIVGKDSLIKDDDKQKIMSAFQKEIMAKFEQKKKEEAEKNKAEGQAFLENNKKDPTVVVTASGLQYKVIKDGTGDAPKATDNVTVQYEGKLINGKVFDSSYKRGEPASFLLNSVIPGWTEGLQLMKKGSIFEFFIPAELAYGDNGSRDIPGHAVLIFKVELVDFAAPAKDKEKEK